MQRVFIFFMMALFAAPGTAQTFTEGRIRAETPGPVISRYIYGQFSEHLGRSIYDGFWVGEGATIPNTRKMREWLEYLTSKGQDDLATLTDGAKVVKTPSYFVFQMYLPFQDTTILPEARLTLIRIRRET